MTNLRSAEALCFCSGGGAQPRKWASERGSTAGERSCIITWLASDLEWKDALGNNMKQHM